MRRGVSLLEILISLTLFLLMLVPLLELLTGSHRRSVSARKLLDATSFAQTLMDAVAELPAGDLAAVTAAARIQLSDDLDDPTLPKGPRWNEIRTYAKYRKPAAVTSWVLTAERTATGHVMVRIHVTWHPPAGEPGSAVSRSLARLARI